MKNNHTFTLWNKTKI